MAKMATARVRRKYCPDNVLVGFNALADLVGFASTPRTTRPPGRPPRHEQQPSMSDNRAPKALVGRTRSTFDWAFRNRNTGKVTMAQFPNLCLGIFLITLLVTRYLPITDTSHTLLDGVVGLSLAWCAADEIIRGLNPWRRILGATFLAVLIVERASR
jgi:hypothetical protein